ncbi:rRNA methyltransferase 3, mitochondrial-like [Ptychodera flava]|uniref:rRNA methyltransferase 3, mitochondrial-like n=1 Tax=Ptychodera flava TaxID=63121 RepID=UPI00396A0F23
MSAPMFTCALVRQSFNFTVKHRLGGQLSTAFCTNQNRNYSRRGLRRKPVKVILPGADKADGTGKPVPATTTAEERSQSHGHKITAPTRDAVKSPHNDLYYEDEAPPKFKFERVGPDDRRVRRVLTLMRSRKYREQTKKVLLEGRRLISDAILAGGECNTVYFSRVENLEGIPWYDTKAEFLKIPYKEVKLWSDVITPQGVLAVFSMPTFEYFLYDSPTETIPLTVICDNIREPGNLGALLRSAVAAGCKKILVTKGCVDIWDLKVLRAAAGAHFRAPIHNNLTWENVTNYFDEDTVVNVADCRTPDGVEELMHEDASVRDIRADLRNLNKMMKTLPDKLEEEIEMDREQKLEVLPSENFYNVDWTKNAAIVIGGESHGLSKEAVQLSDESYGCKVHIPMTRGMDSLNAAMATSIIVFEAKRQWLNHIARKQH